MDFFFQIFVAFSEYLTFAVTFRYIFAFVFFDCLTIGNIIYHSMLMIPEKENIFKIWLTISRFLLILKVGRELFPKDIIMVLLRSSYFGAKSLIEILNLSLCVSALFLKKILSFAIRNNQPLEVGAFQKILLWCSSRTTDIQRLNLRKFK